MMLFRAHFISVLDSYLEKFRFSDLRNKSPKNSKFVKRILMTWLRWAISPFFSGLMEVGRSWPKEKDVEKRRNVLFPFLSKKDWGLSPEEKLVRAVVVILEEKREELGYSLYDYEWYTNSDLPQEGKGDLIFVSLPKKSVLVVEVKAVLESHSDSGRKKALKRAKLKKQVEKYMGHAKSLFPEEANIHGMGITDEETVLYQVENQLLKEKWLEDNEWVRWEPQKPIPGSSLLSWTNRGCEDYKGELFGLLPALALLFPEQVSVSWGFLHYTPKKLYSIVLHLDGAQHFVKEHGTSLAHARQKATVQMIEKASLWDWLVEKHTTEENSSKL